MEEHLNKSTPLRPEGERVLNGPMVITDLNKYISQIKSEKTWENSDHNSITIFKSNNIRIVLMGMHQDFLLKEHATNAEISVQVLEGDILFTADGDESKLSRGEMVSLQTKVPHEIKAIKESFLLLTLATTSK